MRAFGEDLLTGQRRSVCDSQKQVSRESDCILVPNLHRRKTPQFLNDPIDRCNLVHQPLSSPIGTSLLRVRSQRPTDQIPDIATQDFRSVFRIQRFALDPPLTGRLDRALVEFIGDNVLVEARGKSSRHECTVEAETDTAFGNYRSQSAA